MYLTKSNFNFSLPCSHKSSGERYEKIYAQVLTNPIVIVLSIVGGGVSLFGTALGYRANQYAVVKLSKAKQE